MIRSTWVDPTCSANTSRRQSLIGSADADSRRSWVQRLGLIPSGSLHDPSGQYSENPDLRAGQRR